ncbi:MAG: aldo/keto reductase [Proteobacteria bacterium]|nr:aldo/keto reductase [Pseudomonadota bacterium]
MDPFKTRRLGRTSVSLPLFGFGGAGLGNLFDDIEDRTADETLAAAWDEGVRYYDTSPWYGRGLSEHRFGRALYRKPRDEFILSTKVGRLFSAPKDIAAFDASERAWRHGLAFEHRHDYTYEGVMRSFEDSLQRLRLNRIDLLIIHDLDSLVLGSERLVDAHLDQLATSGIMALQDLKASGRIKAIGAGVNQMGTIPKFLDVLDLDFFLVALPYTLAEQPVLDVEFPLCEKRGVGVIIGAVFASGILATGAAPGAKLHYRDPTPDEAERINRIEAVCRKFETPLAAAALQFTLHHPSVASIIPGAIHPSQVKRNIELFRHDTPPQLWAELKAQGLLRSDAPTP